MADADADDLPGQDERRKGVDGEQDALAARGRERGMALVVDEIARENVEAARGRGVVQVEL